MPSLLLIAFAGCGDVKVAPEPADPQATQVFVDPASDSRIDLVLGGTFQLLLTSNPTTGYYWYQTAGDEAVIEQVSEAYTADPAPEGLVGSGGRQEFEFEAIGAGRTVLRLSYQRSEDDVADTVELNVAVSE